METIRDFYANKVCYITVPLNDKGIEEWEEYSIISQVNQREFHFPFIEIDQMMPMFWEINKACNCLIDLFEEDKLEVNQVSKAIEIAEEFAKKHNGPELESSIIRCIEALKIAEKLKMPVYFNF